MRHYIVNVLLQPETPEGQGRLSELTVEGCNAEHARLVAHSLPQVKVAFKAKRADGSPPGYSDAQTDLRNALRDIDRAQNFAGIQFLAAHASQLRMGA